MHARTLSQKPLIGAKNRRRRFFGKNRSLSPWSYKRKPCPSVRIASGQTLPGQYYDEETGLHYNYFRDYDPRIGRYIQADIIGLVGGINIYGYAGQNPLYNRDPFGLAYSDYSDTFFDIVTLRRWTGKVPPSLPQGAVDFSAGLGDSLLLGFGDDIRDSLGIDGGINPCSGFYTGGQIAGVLAGAGGFARTAATGLKRGLSRPNPAFPRGREWVERSHMIPNKRGGPFSWWNVRYVWGTEHALADASRYRFLRRWWKDKNAPYSLPKRIWSRLTAPSRGAVGAGTFGTAAVLDNPCECK